MSSLIVKRKTKHLNVLFKLIKLRGVTHLKINGGGSAAVGDGVKHRQQPVVHELDKRPRRHRPKLRRMELQTRRLPLPAPRLIVGGEDPAA